MNTQTKRFPLPPVEFTFAGFTWPRHVAVLPSGTLHARLARAKNRCAGPYYHEPRPSTRCDKERGFYLENMGMPSLRWQWADKITWMIYHTGWFIDDFCDAKLRGLVFRLPHGRGYLPAYSMGEGMVSVVECHVYPDEIGAAHAADRMAELAAERERDYREQESEE